MDSSPIPVEPENEHVYPVLAAGSLRVPVAEIAGLRKEPGAACGRRPAASLLKHADEQTVLGVASVLRTVERAGWRDRDFTAWGVVAAPRFPGRLSLAPSLEKFRSRGPASVSPLIIPNLSLHAMAGSISLALNAHGANFGVGGGHGHLVEALLCALTAQPDSTAGIWVVATEWSPEPVPDASGGSVFPAEGVAVAIALGPPGCAEAARFRLRMQLSRGPNDDRPSGLVGLASRLEDQLEASEGFSWTCPVPGEGTIVLEEAPSRDAVALRASRESARGRFLDVA